jgi:hypothetical protein
MSLSKLALAAVLLLAQPVFAREPIAPERIRFIHMGGNDCPPCRVWRAVELPKLQQSPAFHSVRYSYVTKTVGSPVPSEAFLPDEVKPLKAKLDYASGGRNGSPHQVIVVDGEVFDYWFGDKSAEQIEAALAALVEGTRYPHRRCIKRTGLKDRSCEINK